MGPPASAAGNSRRSALHESANPDNNGKPRFNRHTAATAMKNQGTRAKLPPVQKYAQG